MHQRFATIRNRNPNGKHTIRISSTEKPDVGEKVRKKWQNALNLAARIAGVPAALIMRVHEEDIEVFVSSLSPENPYVAGSKESLLHGLYCETVMASGKELLVPDALQCPVWSVDNPDVDIDMVAYLGLPIYWPDGEVFGTICLLDNKENAFADVYKDYLGDARQSIETDLELLVVNHELHKDNELKAWLLSVITHDIRGGIGTTNELLSAVLELFDSMTKEELKDKWGVASQSVSFLMTTVEGLLTWAKQNMLNLDVKRETLQVPEVADKVLDFFRQPIQMKNIDVRKDYAEGAGEIIADKEMLQAAIRNLLSNAIKFSNAGGTITIRVCRQGNTSFLVIEDTGRGMDMQKAEKILQADTIGTAEREEGKGAGIGLFLVKDFLKINGIGFELESTRGKGTKATLSW